MGRPPTSSAGRRGVVAAALAWGLVVAGAATSSNWWAAAPAVAQLLPPGWVDPQPAPEPTTPTTAAPPAPSDPPLAGEPAPAPPPEAGDPGDGDAGQGPEEPGGTGSGRAVPPEAQEEIDAIARTSPNDNHALVGGAAALEAAGVPRGEAVPAVFGPFPILGPARWIDDWHYPRWTGATFRFHLGLDLFADHGTPLAAPADGVARVSHNALGGLTVRVVEPDGSSWYLAHLSALADGLVDGAAVASGQVIGYVGDSGNARGGAPHLHLGRYLPGGIAVPPKPFVDAWVAVGAGRAAELLASVRPAATAAVTLAPPHRTSPELATGGHAGMPSSSGLLWASSANPTGGAVAVADAAAASLLRAVDWQQRALAQRALELGWAQATDRARAVLGPLVHPSLRQAAEAVRDR